MAIPMGSGPAALSHEKLAYVQAVLTAGNRVRYCVILLACLVVPMTFVRGLLAGLELLLISALGGLALRSLDPVFAKLFRFTQPSSPGPAIPLMLPLSLLLAFGSLFDGIILFSFIVHLQFPISLVVVVLSLSARIVFLQRVLPIARMLVDPNFVPLSMRNGQLLARGPEPVFDLPTPPEQVLTSGTFKAFAGPGHVLSAGTPSEPARE